MALLVLDYGRSISEGGETVNIENTEEGMESMERYTGTTIQNRGRFGQRCDEGKRLNFVDFSMVSFLYLGEIIRVCKTVGGEVIVRSTRFQ